MLDAQAMKVPLRSGMRQDPSGKRVNAAAALRIFFASRSINSSGAPTIGAKLKKLGQAHLW